METAYNLQAYLLERLAEYTSPYQMAVQNNWSFGLVYRALDGHESDTLRKEIGLRKWPKRSRLIINTTPATIARFHRLQGNMTTGQLLEVLMDKAEGIGVIE